jgi:hypothetical protein
MSLWLAGYPKTPRFDVRFGSRATDLRCPRDVRFSRERTFHYGLLSNSGSRKLHDVRGDAPRFVAREQVRCRAAARFILEVHVDKFLIVSVFHDETGVRFFNDPWWRKAAGR